MSPADDDALTDAYDAGVRSARLEARVENHELRIAAHEDKLRAINGSIERGANQTAELRTEFAKQIGQVHAQQATQGEKLDRFLAEQEKDRAVREALNQSVREAKDSMKEATDRQISSIGFYVATAGVIFTLVGVIFSVLIGVHVI